MQRDGLVGAGQGGERASDQGGRWLPGARPVQHGGLCKGPRLGVKLCRVLSPPFSFRWDPARHRAS